MLMATLNEGEQITIEVAGQEVQISLHRVLSAGRVRLGIIADKQQVIVRLPESRGGREVRESR